MKLSFTFGPRCSGLPKKIQVPWRYRISRRFSDRCLLTHWRSFAALSVDGVLGDDARSTPPNFSLAVLQTEVVESYFDFTSTPGYPPSTVALVMLLALLRPVVLYTLTLLRSALGRFLGRWYFTYQRSLVALSTGPMISLLPGR